MSWGMSGSWSGTGEKAPIGNHPAVLVAIIDMGNQWQRGFSGEPGKWAHRAFFVWELVAEKKSNGFNHTLGIDLTMSFHEKSKLRKLIEARTGKKFMDVTAAKADAIVSAEIGQACLLNVVNNKGGYPIIDGVGALPKGMTCPPPKNTPTTIPFVKGATPDIPEWVPWLFGKKIADRIAESKENGGKGEEGGNGQYSSPPSSSRPAPPPSNGKPPIEDRNELFWVSGGPLDDEKEHPRHEIADWIPSSGMKASELKVCKAGQSTWKAATEYGFKDTPF